MSEQAARPTPGPLNYADGSNFIYPVIPPGWRRLGVGEVIQADDFRETLPDHTWSPVKRRIVGCKVRSSGVVALAYIRFVGIKNDSGPGRLEYPGGDPTGEPIIPVGWRRLKVGELYGPGDYYEDICLRDYALYWTSVKDDSGAVKYSGPSNTAFIRRVDAEERSFREIPGKTTAQLERELNELRAKVEADVKIRCEHEARKPLSDFDRGVWWGFGIGIVGSVVVGLLLGLFK